MSISEILKKLLGEIEPYGDTTIDGKRYYRNEYSIKKIARECKDILQEFGISEED